MADTSTRHIPTTSEINGAKLKVLKHMINTINEEKIHLEQGKVKGLSKQGNIAELRERVAGYYGIDLAAPSAPIPTSAAAVPLPVDFEIGKAQWAWARMLAKEWMDAEAEQKEFKLWPTEMEYALSQDVILQLRTLLPNHHIPTSSPVPSDQDQLQSLIRAAKDGDSTALRQLKSLFATDNGSLDLVPLNVVSSSTSLVAATPPSPSTSFREPSQLLQPPSQLAALTACQEDIEVFKKTDGIREVIEQVRDGTVAHFRAKYGPTQDRKANLEEEFGGDLEQFVSFFTFTGAVKRQKDVSKTRAFRLLVEDLPKRNSALEVERKKDCYKDGGGGFSELLWSAKWDSKNKWEIWCEINPDAKDWS
ncbi:hypothetical protein M422DRAFT_270147 [Sphaerobolus stellatus SS14]|uniref:Uncharacterized protein n=1 Tax=Sphaerobolus stellatus (strain SS14) TaxID=990650 RepID=A0A0C9U2X8_SPHS4|nr:hypothetical protein M422DRAFT_270147 [Sphaerobolus stellatus SS14]